MNEAYEKKLQNQFGSFCIKVLKHEAIQIHREKDRVKNFEITMSETGHAERNQIISQDRYFKMDHVFEVQGIPVVVAGDLLAEAIGQLPQGRRDVILLSYFLEMSDMDIGKQLNLVRSAVAKRRVVSLKELYKFLKKEGFDCQDL